MRFRPVLLLASVIAVLGSLPLRAQETPPMSFFITSVGPGSGADLGGLAGADAHCQSLAAAVGADEGTWRAYLSAAATDDSPLVHARDRIGEGPWHNVEGVQVAADLDELHGDNNLTRETTLTETGESPNRHDILTGSQADGTAADDGVLTCGNWTSSGAGSAQLGHHDRRGGGADPTSWNSAHASRGCSESDLRSTSGDGLFYCFAQPGPGTAVKSASWGVTKRGE